MESKIKEAAQLILAIIDELAQPYVKNPVVKRFWNWFFVQHGRLVINNTNDMVLKIAMQRGYEKLKPIFEQKNLANELKTSMEINSPEMTKKLMKMPDFEKAIELEINELFD